MPPVENPVSDARVQSRFDAVLNRLGGSFWFIFKNVLGWILILASFPIGIIIPGPGGVPIFIVGFALVTFPGKRRLTSRVMRGRGLPIESQAFTFVTALFSVLATSTLMWLASRKFSALLARFDLTLDPQSADMRSIVVALVCVTLIALGVTWIVTRLSLRVVNLFLKRLPMIRRAVRPWLRKRGVRLLPARRKPGGPAGDPEEILQIDARHHNRLRSAAAILKPWLRRAITVGVTVYIVVRMVEPLLQQWPLVRLRVDDLRPGALVASVLMFAVFLFAFRALAWRRILKAFGHKLPTPAAVRIWSTSELARYLPGAIWQVVGRVWLVKPYGVSGSICSTTQVLELCIFLLANVMLAAATLLWHGARVVPQARPWLWTSIALLPLLSLLLHPRVFYGIANAVLRRLGKDAIVKRLRGRSLVHLLGWTLLGLLWQSLAIWLVLAAPLGLKIDWWWAVAGSYSLAWIAGFLAIWAPGGIGVREVVFVATMQMVLPQAARATFDDPGVLTGLLVFLGFVLRLWSIAGECIVAALAHLADYRGALGDPSAPGRISRPATGV